MQSMELGQDIDIQDPMYDHNSIIFQFIYILFVLGKTSFLTFHPIQEIPLKIISVLSHLVQTAHFFLKKKPNCFFLDEPQNEIEEGKEKILE